MGIACCEMPAEALPELPARLRALGLTITVLSRYREKRCDTGFEFNRIVCTSGLATLALNWVPRPDLPEVIDVWFVSLWYWNPRALVHSHRLMKQVVATIKKSGGCFSDEFTSPVQRS